MVFFETFYKTDNLKDFPQGEYYQVRLESEIVSGSEIFLRQGEARLLQQHSEAKGE
jgi:hypothetical protein